MDGFEDVCLICGTKHHITKLEYICAPCGIKKGGEWFDVNKKTPKDYKPYLCMVRSNDMGKSFPWLEILHYDFNKNEWAYNDMSSCAKEGVSWMTTWWSVMHWMELPEMPR
jgi:hypothetical protein